MFEDNLLASIAFTHPGGTATNDQVGDLAYEWDANKNKTRETISGTIAGYSFDTTLGSDPDGYDDEDRLTYFKRSNNANPQTWELSLVGDWNSWSNLGSSQTRTHGAAHEFTSFTGASSGTLTYDVKGNLLTRPASLQSPALTLTWDFDNRMQGADTDGTPASLEVAFEYDAVGRRVARSGPDGNVVYIHGANHQGGQQVVADYTRGSAAGTTPLFRYVWGSYIDEPILRQTGSTTLLYYHHNQQFSTVALTNSSGLVASRYAYTAYGEQTLLNFTGAAQDFSTYGNRYSYTGREWDNDLKLHYFRARWYDAVAGRFIGRDPLGFVDGMSLYRGYFVPGNMDPTGTEEFICRDGSVRSVPDPVSDETRAILNASGCFSGHKPEPPVRPTPPWLPPGGVTPPRRPPHHHPIDPPAELEPWLECEIPIEPPKPSDKECPESCISKCLKANGVYWVLGGVAGVSPTTSLPLKPIGVRHLGAPTPTWSTLLRKFGGKGCRVVSRRLNPMSNVVSVGGLSYAYGAYWSCYIGCAIDNDAY